MLTEYVWDAHVKCQSRRDSKLLAGHFLVPSLAQGARVDALVGCAWNPDSLRVGCGRRVPLHVCGTESTADMAVMSDEWKWTQRSVTKYLALGKPAPTREIRLFQRNQALQ